MNNERRFGSAWRASSNNLIKGSLGEIVRLIERFDSGVIAMVKLTRFKDLEMIETIISWISSRLGSCKTNESMVSLLEMPPAASASTLCSKISSKHCWMTAILCLASLHNHDLQTSLQELMTDCGDGHLLGPEDIGNPMMWEKVQSASNPSNHSLMHMKEKQFSRSFHNLIDSLNVRVFPRCQYLCRIQPGSKFYDDLKYFERQIFDAFRRNCEQPLIPSTLGMQKNGTTV